MMKALWAAIAALLCVQETTPEEELPAAVPRIFGAFDRQAKGAWQRVSPPADWAPRENWRADPSRPAQLRLGNGIRLDAQSASELSLTRTKSRYRFRLTKGECLFDIGFTSGKAPEEAIEVVLPNGEVLVPASTKAFVRVICRIDREKDHIAVLNGSVTIKRKDEQVEVRQGEGLEVGPKAGLTPKKEDVLTQAAWTRWEEKQRAKKNLIKDGDMESAKTGDWRTLNATVSKELREVFEGRQSLKVTGGKSSEPMPGAYQDIKVTPGMKLRFTAWVKSPQTFKPEGMGVSGDLCVLSLGAPASVASGGWGYFESEMQVPDGKTILRLILPSPSGSAIFCDALILTEEK